MKEGFRADSGESVFREGVFHLIISRIHCGQYGLADTDARKLARLRWGQDTLVAGLVPADGIQVYPAPKIGDGIGIPAGMEVSPGKLRVALEKLSFASEVIVKRGLEETLGLIWKPDEQMLAAADNGDGGCNPMP